MGGRPLGIQWQYDNMIEFEDMDTNMGDAGLEEVPGQTTMWESYWLLKSNDSHEPREDDWSQDGIGNDSNDFAYIDGGTWYINNWIIT